MSVETIGPWTVSAEGILQPAAGIVKTSIDPAPPVYDSSQAAGRVSRITTAAGKATPTLALAEAQAYRTAVGALILFRGIYCFVVDVSPDHRAAYNENGEAMVTAEWSLVTPLNWVPA
jgi:hypothetical protein